MKGKGVYWLADEWKRALERGRDDAATAAAEGLSNIIKASMPGLQRGKPSKPGRFPNRQTDQLGNSITWQRATGGVAYVGSDKPYARWLNNGVPWTSPDRILPRPWAKLGVAKAQRVMNALAIAAFRKALAK